MRLRPSRRAASGKRDAEEGAEIARAVDQRRLLQFDRKVEERLAQDDDDERQNEGGVDQDQGEPGVEQAERAHDQIEGDDRRHRRQHALRQEPDSDVACSSACAR